MAIITYQFDTSKPLERKIVEQIQEMLNGKANSLQNGRISLHQHLQRHHADFLPPLSQKELSALFGWSQPTSSRRMKEVFGEEGIMKYRALCKDKTILFFLTSNPPLNNLAS